MRSANRGSPPPEQHRAYLQACRHQPRFAVPAATAAQPASRAMLLSRALGQGMLSQPAGHQGSSANRPVRRARPNRSGPCPVSVGRVLHRPARGFGASAGNGAHEGNSTAIPCMSASARAGCATKKRGPSQSCRGLELTPPSPRPGPRPIAGTPCIPAGPARPRPVRAPKLVLQSQGESSGLPLNSGAACRKRAQNRQTTSQEVAVLSIALSKTGKSCHIMWQRPHNVTKVPLYCYKGKMHTFCCLRRHAGTGKNRQHFHG